MDDFGFDIKKDPICVVGLACRLPGGICSPPELWDFLAKKQSAQGPLPSQRFNIKGFHHPASGERGGAMSGDGGYFLQRDVRQFDNSFFGINNLETTYMDPQQRQLLEVVYECFENAGVSMDKISGTNTGVYVGNFTVDYQAIQNKDPDYGSRYSATGSGTAILANRISYIFNLQGPSFTLDTACSSSLYCIHNAIRAIQAGDCDGAIAAGANLITSPEQHLGTSLGGVLSPTSTCHTFDISADGYGRAEGINAVYLKRFSSALKDGDKISAVIRGTAVNANGKTPGIVQPSPTLQEAVIRKAYLNAGIDFSGTDYIECHGTGTAIGDPIEVDALASCFGHREGYPVMIGSVKTNLGHSEAASGLTSLLKIVLAFENNLIPPTYGVKNLNPKLKLESRNFKVVTELEKWPRDVRRASINSFGYGGANAHLIVESVGSYLNNASYGDQIIGKVGDWPLVLPVSAMSTKSLEIQTKQLSGAIEKYDRDTLIRLAYTLAQRRSHLREKDYLLTQAGNDATGKLIQTDAINFVSTTSSNALPIAFIFTGQGAQYAGMGKELLNTESFSITIRQLDNVLQALPPQYRPDWTLEQTILDTPDSSQVNNVTRSQPLCTAIQIALVGMLRSWGVSVSAVVGHSSGEIAAAYTAGLLTATHAILVAYFRGYVVGQQQANGGAMMAAGLGVEAAEKLIKDKGLEGQVCVACVNSPESVTLSGLPEGVEILDLEIKEQGKFARKLETGGRAYHSHMMQEVGGLYEELLGHHISEDVGTKWEGIHQSVKMYSSAGYAGDVLGIFDFTTNSMTAKYWKENLEKPVQFSSAVKNLVSDQGRHHFIEIGPHPALKGPIQQIRTGLKLDNHNLPYASTLIRKQNASLCMKTLAGNLYVHGYKIHWNVVNNIPKCGMTLLHDLPTYPWDYRTDLLWYEPRASVELRNREYVRHELLGSKQLAGDGINWCWRNIIRLSEMPWICGHKVEDQIVFPAAGYLSVAIEAISQSLGVIYKDKDKTIEFRDVHIATALVLPDDSNEPGKGVELHTSMSRQKLSTVTVSSDWYEFSISSWVAGHTTIHCAGSIRVNDSVKIQGSVMVSNIGTFETYSAEKWYAKAKEQGLCFEGPFRSLTSVCTDGNLKRLESLCTTHLIPPGITSHHPGVDHYSMHPITIDTCFQAPIISATGGNIKALRSYLPVFISEAHVRTSGGINPNCEAIIHTRSTKTSFATQQIDSTLRDSSGTPFIDLKNVRFSLYEGKKNEDSYSGSDRQLNSLRHPFLRTRWKPDILRFDLNSQKQVNEYVGEFAKNNQLLEIMPESHANTIGALLDLAGHKKPKLRVMEIAGGSEDHTKQWLSVLDKDTAFPRCFSWDITVVDEEGKLQVEVEGPFDIIYIPEHSISEKSWPRVATQLFSLISEHGIVLSAKTDIAISQLRAAHFTVLDVQGQALLAKQPLKTAALEGRNVYIILHKPSQAVLELAASLENHFRHRAGVGQISIGHLGHIETVGLSGSTICISLIELEREFLASMGQEEMDNLHILTDTVTQLVWLIGANMLDKPDPNLTMVYGFSRALMLEQPSLCFSVLDIGQMDLALFSMKIVCESVTKVLISFDEKDDKEFSLVNGLLYISRFIPDHRLNSLFRRRLGTQEPQSHWKREVPLIKALPARLSIAEVGITDSIHFQEICEPPTSLPPGFIDVDIKAVSLNAKDVYTVGGHVETRTATTALEFSGIVAKVGYGVDFQPGDRVVVSAPNSFTTRERVPAWAAHKMLPEEEFSVIATLPLVYSTALYALEDRARLRVGESILIHAGAGALGIALIAIAQRAGAFVYTTVGSQAKRDYLTHELGIPETHIFSSRDPSFVGSVRTITGGRGVDVIVNSLTGDLMHASWECIADFGRFIEVGKKELVGAGKLNMSLFLRNATFTAFDLSDLFFHQDPYYRNIWISKTKQVLELYRSGQIKPVPKTTFDVSDIAQAYRHFSTPDRIGKVVISLQNSQSYIPAAPAKFLTIFSPDKIYLLVGCLGGLGRSLSRWMLARGARKFCFLGRSGCDKPSAQSLVSRLRFAGAMVTVVRGDVSSVADVNAAVAACNGSPIGGVIQAAMGLQEALFTSMTSKAWQTAIQPKWAGTWNLHNALEKETLDFFLLTSSMSGSIGTATESNYCAANAFLDAFARWRRAQGKPAISIGLGMISEVGYLHENSEIEALLLRRGIHPLNEDEFLQVIDMSLGGTSTTDNVDIYHECHSSEESHILTGLEPLGFRKLMAQGFDVSLEVTQDPRASILSAAVAAEMEARNAVGQIHAADLSRLADLAPWLKEVPANIFSAFASEVDAVSLQDAVLRLTKKRFSNLILMPSDQIDGHKPISQFGVDSMIASEFRTWFWGTFKADMPILNILSPQNDLNSLAEIVVAKLDESSKFGNS